MLEKLAGQTSVLCSAQVSFTSADTVQAMLERAADALNEDAG
jgi:hypothetical protein